MNIESRLNASIGTIDGDFEGFSVRNISKWIDRRPAGVLLAGLE